MGVVIYFPFENSHRGRYTVKKDEPAQVIVLPVIRLERRMHKKLGHNQHNVNLPAVIPPGGPQCRR